MVLDTVLGRLACCGQRGVNITRAQEKFDSEFSEIKT